MSKHEHAVHCINRDAPAEDEWQHVLIPACEFGKELLQKFVANKPNWRPRTYGRVGGHGGNGDFEMCECCRECLSISKAINVKPQLMGECSGLSKSSRPASISLSKPAQHARVPVAEIAASCQVSQSLSVSKGYQRHADKGEAAEDVVVLKSPFARPAGKGASMDKGMEQMIRQRRGKEEYTELTDSGERVKALEIGVALQGDVSEQATSSVGLSEDDTMTTPHMEAPSLSDYGGGVDSSAVAKAASRYTGDVSMQTEDPMLVDSQSLFDFVVTTRKIPYGNCLLNLDVAMQKRLYDYFKMTCPPCPHCNTKMHVKFRYFNNSGKSSLLQPRYTCRNLETCLTVQEKSGKAGSRDFTLPRPRELEQHKIIPGVHQNRVTGMQGRAIRQPQMIPRVGSKRPAQDFPSEVSERSAKLPNTTLSLQSLNGFAPKMGLTNLQIVESGNGRSLQISKPAEDSNSSSSMRTASDERMGINVRYRTEASSENGLVVVKQPISLHTVASTPSNSEAGVLDITAKAGKIAEVNICMYIDLSGATTSS